MSLPSIGVWAGAVAFPPKKEKVCGPDIAGIINCQCGHSGSAKNEQGERITWSYWEALHLILSDGYTCPKCQLFMKGMRASKGTVRNWKKKYPEWDWSSFDIEN